MEDAYWLASYGLLGFLSYSSLGDDTTHNELGLPISIINQKTAPADQFDKGSSSTEIPRSGQADKN